MRRLALVLLTLLAAGVSAYQALFAYWRNQAVLSYDPSAGGEPVPAYAAGDPAIAVTAAQARLAQPGLSTAELQTIGANARAALRAEPLNAAALYTLGMVDGRTRPDGGLTVFRLVERLSRREVGNELMLERQAAISGDIAGAIARVDHLVSAVPSLGDQLLPPLVPSLANPAIRAEFLRYSARPWFLVLVGDAATKGVPPGLAAGMLHAAAAFNRFEVLDGIRAKIVRRAFTEGDYDAIRAVLDDVPARDRDGLARLGFFPATINPHLAPLAWQLAGEPQANATLAGDGLLTLVLAPEQTGTLAQRITMLPPGTYVFSHQLAVEANVPRVTVTWEVSCGGGQAAPLLRERVPGSSGTAGGVVGYRAQIVIPPYCAAQQWLLMGTGDVAQASSQVELRDIAMVRQ